MVMTPSNIQQKIEVTQGGIVENVRQVINVQTTDWRPRWHAVLKEWTGEHFQRFTRDLLQAEGYNLTPRNGKHLGFDKENHFLATKEMARGRTTWLVKCVHYPEKQLKIEHAYQIIQALKSYSSSSSIQGYRIITSGLLSRDVEDTLRSQLAGKKLGLWYLSEIEERVLKGYPELLERHANIQMPSKEESEFARYYQLLNEDLFNQEVSAKKAELFYKGNPPDWDIIQNGLDIRREVELIEEIPIRKTYDEIYQQILHLSDEGQRGLSFVLLTAEAGSGKTTFLFRLGYDLYCHQDDYDRYWVMRSRSDNLLQLDPLLKFYQQSQKHLYILVDIHDVEGYKTKLKGVMHELAIRQDVPITIIVAVRYNEWKQKGGDELNIIAQRRLEIRLGKLSECEASKLLDLLQEHGQLGELKNLSRNIQLQKLLSATAADKQLLVALMEVTHGKKFEEILINEYQNLQPEAKLAYRYVCLFHAYGVLLPIKLLRSALGLSKLDFATKIKASTELVIVEDFDRTSCVRTRHRQIAHALKTGLNELNDYDFLLPMLSNIISSIEEHVITDRYALLKFLLKFVNDSDKTTKNLVKEVLAEHKDKFEGIRFRVKQTEERYIELSEWGYLYYSLGDLDTDRHYVSDAIDITTANNAAELYYYHGRVSEKLNFNAEAEEYYDRAYNLGLRSTKFLHRYFSFAVDNNSLYKALKLLEETFINDLDNNKIRRLVYNLLDGLLSEKKYDEVIKICQAGLMTQNESMRIRLRYKLANALERRNEPGDIESSLREYKNILKYQPDHKMAMSRSAAILEKLGPEYYFEADTLYRQAIEIHKKKDKLWAQLRSNYAFLLEKLGENLISDSFGKDPDRMAEMGQRCFARAEKMRREASEVFSGKE